MKQAHYQGIWPVAPTPFHNNGEVDYDGMKAIIDCMIDQGVDGICILANFSEQFLISDAEREKLTRISIEHADGRVPIIVTISHYATKIAVERAAFAKSLWAEAVMMMPPYHGALLKGTAQQSFEQIKTVGEVGISIMIQDAPLSGVDLPVPLLVRMAHEIEMVRMFKIECAGAAGKLRTLIAEGGAAIEAPFDGEEAITLLADLDAGARGSMTSALIPDLIRPVIMAHLGGHREQAVASYSQILGVINHENRQCGFRATKVAMVAGGVIKSDFCRHPIKPLDEDTRKLLLNFAKKYDLVSFNWGK